VRKGSDTCKCKAKLPVLNLAPRHTEAGMNGDIAPCILNLGTNGGEWSASRAGPGTHWLEG
jgi:hypothetical protein